MVDQLKKDPGRFRGAIPLIPRGVQCYFGEEVNPRRRVEAILAAIARNWGFHEIILPFFDYLEDFVYGLGSQRGDSALLSIIALGLVVSFALAADVAKGKALFNDVKFAGGTAGKSCNSCHPEGKGLEKSGEKKEFNIMGKKQTDLEEAVNLGIVNANKGKEIDTKSEQMKDIVAYIKSLKPAEMPRKTG